MISKTSTIFTLLVPTVPMVNGTVPIQMINNKLIKKGDLLNLCGLNFMFIQGNLVWQKNHFSFSVTELLQNGNNILYIFKSVNQKGYMTSANSSNPMFSKIKDHLIKMVFKKKQKWFWI